MGQGKGPCPGCGKVRRLTPKGEVFYQHEVQPGVRCPGSGGPAQAPPLPLTKTSDEATTASTPHKRNRPQLSEEERQARRTAAEEARAAQAATVMHEELEVSDLITEKDLQNTSEISRNRPRMSSVLWPVGALLFVVLLITVPQKFSRAAPERPDAAASSGPAVTESGTPTGAVPQAATATPQASAAWPEGTDPQMGQMLAAAGISDAAIRTLAAVGQETGYLWRSRPPTDGEAQSFAYMVLLECRDVANGVKTWQDSAEEAMSTGASAADASRMTDYLQNVYCP